MNTPQELKAIVSKMLRDKDKACVSIILPMYHLSPDQGMDKLHLKKAIEQASGELLLRYSTDAMSLMQSLNNVASGVELNHTQMGIGIYVSETVQAFVFFPFVVEEKVFVSSRFDMRDILFLLQYSGIHHVLHLAEKTTRLYSGTFYELTEVQNEDFPFTHNSEHEYQHSSPGTSYAGYAHVKSFEKDKTLLTKTRFNSLTHEIDTLLNKYIHDDEALIVCGEKRHTSAFLNRTNQIQKVIGAINGNYDHYTEQEMAQLITPTVLSNFGEIMLDELNELREKIGEARAVTGFTKVWEAVEEKRARTLIIEKSYEPRTFKEKLKVKEINHYSRTENSANDLINMLVEMVTEQGGKIVFVENGMLSEFRSIALITRY